MATTYTLIDKATLGSAQSSITFTSIPSTYTDLLIKFSARNSGSNGYDNLKLSFNGTPSGTSYSGRVLAHYTTGVLSQTSSSADSFIYQYTSGANATSNTFANGEIYLPNYTSSNYKSISADSVSENNSGSTYSTTGGFGAGLWSNTAIISSIVLTASTGNFETNSSFYLYGIKNS